MRRALGLNSNGGHTTVQQRPDQARQRHRFVQDGGVPVVVLNHRTDETAGLRERITELEAMIEAERTAHSGTRRTVSEQHATIQSLETRLAHAELAHGDALAQERRSRVTLQDELANLHAAAAPRPAPTPVQAPAPAAPIVPPAATDAAPALVAARALDATAAPKKRGRPRIHPPKEPKPVRWWTPSFKAKTKA